MNSIGMCRKDTRKMIIIMSGEPLLVASGVLAVTLQVTALVYSPSVWHSDASSSVKHTKL